MLIILIILFTVYLPILSGGMAAGWTSPTEKYLRGLENPDKLPLLTLEQFSWVNSFLYFGGIAGCFIWNPVTERFGRKFAGYLIGSILTVAWSGILCTRNFETLLLCRFGLGMSFGGGIVVGMAYSNEIASPRIKGQLCSMGAFFINFGFLAVYLVGCFFSYDTLNITCVSIPILFLILFFRLPESPIYLMMENQEKKAIESMMWFRGNKVHKVDQEMAAIQASSSYKTRVTMMDILASKKISFSVLTAMMLFMGQQLSGITILTSYTVTIFAVSGSTFSAEKSTIIMGAIQAVGSVVPGLLGNRVNHKYMLVCTFVSAALSLLTYGGCFLMIEKGYSHPILNALPLICMLGYILSFTTGIAPIPFILFTRMFEPNVMSLALCCGQLAGSITAFLTAKVFPTLTLYFNYSGTFYILAASNLVMAAYVMTGITNEDPPLPQKMTLDVLIPADQNGELKSKADLVIN